MNAKVISGGKAFGTKVILEDGGELRGITHIQWTAAVDDVCRLDVQVIMSKVEAEGVLKLFSEHPTEGGIREVAKVIYADGSEWAAG
ncbi:hypothetical protein NUH86_16040 [Sphingobium sp. JS3065]|uniref:hypothetical protein n=1 Tax=Sphingobium sp. JS3065 TaxID=2970925 RepID=UPI002263FFCE|nr:hypothetical protein [Sphingobium sp. JS3065]UZW54965.1 hypothetical protein NUH86_16040 [Sphingobium sp. JS3065]